MPQVGQPCAPPKSGHSIVIKQEGQPGGACTGKQRAVICTQHNRKDLQQCSRADGILNPDCAAYSLFFFFFENYIILLSLIFSSIK